MDGMYDSFGDLLKEALEKGEIPQKPKKNKTESNNEAQNSEKSDPFANLPQELKSAFNALHSSPDESLEQIKKKYRELLKLYHPDTAKNKDDSQITKNQTENLIKSFEIVKKYFENLKN